LNRLKTMDWVKLKTSAIAVSYADEPFRLIMFTTPGSLE